jgi:hypothetical protein
MANEDDPVMHYAVRIPTSIVDRVRQSAWQQGISVNSELVRRISQDLPPLSPEVLPGKHSRKRYRKASHQVLEIEEEATRIYSEQPALAAAIARLVGNLPPKMGGLTDKQAKLLDFIRKHAAEHDGSTPTYEEMMRGIGLASKSGINRLVVGLEERGYLTRSPKRAQSIKLT